MTGAGRARSPSAIAEGPLGLPLSHLSYVVPDLREAVRFWTTTFNAGPFYVLADIEFEHLSYDGGPAVFEHSAAYGQWGAIAVELQQLDRVEPQGLRERLDRPINHVAYVSPDAGADSARLERMGLPLYLDAGFDEVRVRFHDVPQLGHAIELHQGSAPVVAYFEGLADAAQGWDGSVPLRAGSPDDWEPLAK